ncbi:MAG: arsenite methyltransferase [Rubrivivax sp.]|nr:arsenite methyltransferase [Rubrivivax sp.]
MFTDTSVKEIVRQKYGEAAQRVGQGTSGSCCGGGTTGASSALGGCDPITSNLYDPAQAGAVPETAMLASLGCGNPTALAELKPGETVLDLGSGGGIDVLLSARRVGPTGTAYGLDMTDEMLALAQENKRQSGLANVHFLKGEIEHIPLPANSVDVIISNCVINLAADKDRVLAEALRVLKPGGRFAVSDVVVRGEVPPAIRRNMELWIGCVAGALGDREYLDKLARAGFTDAGIEITRVYNVDDAREFLAAQNADLQQLAAQVDGKFASGFIRATKPAGALAGLASAAAAGMASAAAASADEPATAAASCCGPSACCGR